MLGPFFPGGIGMELDFMAPTVSINIPNIFLCWGLQVTYVHKSEGIWEKCVRLRGERRLIVDIINLYLMYKSDVFNKREWRWHYMASLLGILRGICGEEIKQEEIFDASFLEYYWTRILSEVNWELPGIPGISRGILSSCKKLKNHFIIYFTDFFLLYICKLINKLLSC